jgi:hypothetical protein
MADLQRGDHIELRDGRTWRRAKYLKTAPNGRILVRKLKMHHGQWVPATRFIDPVPAADVRPIAVRG